MTSELVNKIRKQCAEQGLRLTPVREMVLQIIAEANKPLGAYDILDAMAMREGKKPKPPTVYRAVEFLLAHRFIHRIESLNAYITCHAGHRHKGSQFMICEQCGTVTEAHICDLPKPIQNVAHEKRFQLSHWNLELHGICAACG